MPQGYTTPLALTPELRAQGELLRDAHGALERGDGRPLAALISDREIDLVIVHKQAPSARAPMDSEVRMIWAPFRLVREELVRSRQLGPIFEQPVPPATLQRERAVLTGVFGPPIHEDDAIVVFRSS
jgi:hypothetical protein